MHRIGGETIRAGEAAGAVRPPEGIHRDFLYFFAVVVHDQDRVAIFVIADDHHVVTGIGKLDPQVGQFGDVAPDHDRTAGVYLALHPVPGLIRIVGLLAARLNVQSSTQIQFHIAIAADQVNGRRQAGIPRVHEGQATAQAKHQAFTGQAVPGQAVPAEPGPVQQIAQGAGAQWPPSWWG